MDGSLTALDRVLALSTLLAEDTARFAADHGLTPARVHTLWELHTHGPMLQKDLAARLGVVPRTVTGLVDGLAGSGHVERAEVVGDRRAVLVRLTDRGATLASDLVTMHGELAEQLFGGFGEARLDRFTRDLDEVLARVTALLDEEPRA